MHKLLQAPDSFVSQKKIKHVQNNLNQINPYFERERKKNKKNLKRYIISTAQIAAREKGDNLHHSELCTTHLFGLTVTEQHSHIYAPLSTRGHCGYTNRLTNTGSMENLQGNQDSFILLAIGSSLKSMILPYYIHIQMESTPSGRHFSACKQNCFFSNSWDFQSSDQRKGCQYEGGVAGNVQSTAEVHS